MPDIGKWLCSTKAGKVGQVTRCECRRSLFEGFGKETSSGRSLHHSVPFGEVLPVSHELPVPPTLRDVGSR